jgi:hypothetical protein
VGPQSGGPAVVAGADQKGNGACGGACVHHHGSEVGLGRLSAAAELVNPGFEVGGFVRKFEAWGFRAEGCTKLVDDGRDGSSGSNCGYCHRPELDSTSRFSMTQARLV